MAEYLELVEGSFTAEHEQKAQEWPYVAYSIEEDRVIYSIIQTEDGYVLWVPSTSTCPTSGYQEVDLGLRTADGKKILFADRNLGATSPDEPGMYVAWGETEGVLIQKQHFSEAEFNQYLLEHFSISLDDLKASLPGVPDNLLPKVIYLEGGIPLDDDAYNWSEYKYSDAYGNITKYANGLDNTYTLLPEDDAAYVHTQGLWRIPTPEELELLVNNCTITATGIDGSIYNFPEILEGDQQTLLSEFKFTSNIEGYTDKFITFPACGAANGNIISDSNRSLCLTTSYTDQPYATPISYSQKRHVLMLYQLYSDSENITQNGIISNSGVKRSIGCIIRPVTIR